MKQMSIILSFLVCIIFSFSQLSFAQSAKDAYYSLKKLQAKVKSAINYRDYSTAIGDAHFAVTMFLESKSAKKQPELSDHLKKTLEYYEIANKIWAYTFNTEPDKYTRKSLYFFDSDVGKYIKTLYPKTTISAEKAQCYYLPNLLNDIWGDASNELERASTYFKE